jgi:hypothetical protein
MNLKAELHLDEATQDYTFFRDALLTQLPPRSFFQIMEDLRNPRGVKRRDEQL